jgi:hypothetical protein
MPGSTNALFWLPNNRVLFFTNPKIGLKSEMEI